MRLEHFTHIADLGPEGVEEVIQTAMAWKKATPELPLRDRLLGMIFFDPSLRTRTSFEAAMLRAGGHSIVLEIGKGTWKLEDRDGVVMDGDRAEHLREAVPVLCRYVDALAVRAFSSGESDAEDERDAVIRGFRRFATRPVITMESAREHPCQGLADVLTLRENFGATKGLPVTLSWAPHIKPLAKAVPNSFALTAAAAGCDVRIAHPEGFDLHPAVLEEAQRYAAATGGSVTVTHDQEEALAGSAALYAKSWRPADGQDLPVRAHENWMPTAAHFDAMRDDAVFMHCLPVRRNVEVSDEVLDHSRCRVVDEAENRYHVQRVLLSFLMEGIE